MVVIVVLSCYFQTQTVYFMKLKQMMLMKIFMRIDLYVSVNKTVIDKMKDEISGKIISEFVGLQSKMYYLVMVDNEGTKKAKGVNKNVVKSMIHKEYVDALCSKGLVRHKMNRIQTELRKTGTYGVCKISLLRFDDKRYIFDDGVSSGLLLWGCVELLLVICFCRNVVN